MATQLQMRRGTASEIAAFTGAEGEVVVNTTNDSIVVSDGSTAGGFEQARADLNNVSDASLNAALTGNTVSALTITTLTLGSTAITATGAEINILDGVTATAAELNILDGVTSTAAELNILDGVTATTAELNYVDGVTSAIQTQLDAKAPLAQPQFTNRVGIGVAAHASDALNITSTNQHIRLNNGSELGILSLTSDGDLDFWAHGADEKINFRTGTGSGTVAMNVVGTNVGIGSIPSYNFHVTGSGDTIAAVTAGASSVAALNLGNDTNKADGGIRYDNSADALILRSGNAERMRISGGKVGIGTTDMQDQLNVGGAASGDSAIYILGSRGSADNLAAGNLTFRNVSNGTGDVNLTRIQTLTGTGSSQSQKGQLTFSTNAGSSLVERMRISSDGAVILKPGGITTGLRLQGRSSDNNFFIQFNSNDGNTNYASVGVVSSDSFLQFSSDKHKFTNQATNSEYARFTNLGSFLMGETSPVSSSRFLVSFNGTNFNGMVAKTTRAATGTSFHVFVNSSNQVAGVISHNGSTTVNYGSSSDQRLKESIVDAPSASDDIDAIKVRSFDWKADGEHEKYGFIAQELKLIAPKAVSGMGMPDEEDPMLGVDPSKLVPMLVKEIQSLRARVAQLESN